MVACQPSQQQPVACTLDAKICPDGSAVGRVGPNCEFAACPEPTTPELPPFVPGSTFKEYKSTDPQMCMRMKFTCDGDEYFGDETGCGCVRAHQDATVTTCAADYDPVCGWSDPAKIQCIAYPCAQTYSNLCQASLDMNVGSTTAGECPAPGSAPTTSGRTYVQTNQTLCAATDWICGEGEQQFYDETGCGCEKVDGKKQAIDCTEPRPQACTKEYMPVCGQKEDGTSDTYGNKCTACADKDVLSYVNEACEQPQGNELGLVAGTRCEDPRPEMCTMDWTPVCGRKADGSQATYGNACGACADKEVEWHSPGECTSNESNTLK